jgi:hypothetical protein
MIAAEKFLNFVLIFLDTAGNREQGIRVKAF